MMSDQIQRRKYFFFNFSKPVEHFVVFFQFSVIFILVCKEKNDYRKNKSKISSYDPKRAQNINIWLYDSKLLGHFNYSDAVCYSIYRLTDQSINWKFEIYRLFNS
jgi:hypothetical protein